MWKTAGVAAALAALLAVCAAGGCGAAQTTEPLDDAVQSYNDAIRWERFEAAAQRIPPEIRDDFLDQRDRLHEDLRIHHFEVVRVRFGPQQRRARVQVKYMWYLDSRGTVHETHAVQRWERRGRFWMLTGEIRLRGEPMPGVSEPEPDAGAGAAAEGATPGQAQDQGEDQTKDPVEDQTGVPLPDPPADAGP